MSMPDVNEKTPHDLPELPRLIYSFIYSPDDYSAISGKTTLQPTPDNL